MFFFVRGHTKETLYGIQYCNHICSISTKARTMFKKWFNDLRGSLLYHFFFHLTSHNPGKGVQTLHHQRAPVSICGSFRWSAHSSAYSGAGIQARWFSPWWRLEIGPTIPGRSFYPTLHYMLSKIVQVPIIHRKSLYWNVTCPFDCTQKIHMQVGPSGCPSSYSVMPLPYIVVYPTAAKPLLVSTEEPHETAWLPPNDDLDYVVSKHAKTGKHIVSSPGLGYCEKVARHEWRWGVYLKASYGSASFSRWKIKILMKSDRSFYCLIDSKNKEKES